VFVEENLTVWRSHLVAKLRQQREVNGLRTSDGKIIFRTQNKFYMLNDPEDFLRMPFSDDFYRGVDIDPALRYD
jgi:hypothetical protein